LKFACTQKGCNLQFDINFRRFFCHGRKIYFDYTFSNNTTLIKKNKEEEKALNFKQLKKDLNPCDQKQVG
jgi:hypothetical protein